MKTNSLNNLNNKESILLISDNYIELQLLKYILHKYNTVLSNSYSESIELIEKEQITPSLIFIDNTKDLGVKFFNRLIKTKNIPTVIIALAYDPFLKEEILNAGAYAFICKPYTIEKIRLLAHEILNTKRQEKVETPCLY